MAADILSNSATKLNLYRNQAEILLDMILVGSKMARGINRLESGHLPQELAVLGELWPDLLAKLGESFV